mgnify:CR=1 FL=1
MKNIWIKIKIFIKLNFIYPISKTYSKIHSILPKGIRLGANVAIEENVIFENSDFIIGNHVYIAKNTFFASCSEILRQKTSRARYAFSVPTPRESSEFRSATEGRSTAKVSERRSAP